MSYGYGYGSSYGYGNSYSRYPRYRSGWRNYGNSTTSLYRYNFGNERPQPRNERIYGRRRRRRLYAWERDRYNARNRWNRSSEREPTPEPEPEPEPPKEEIVEKLLVKDVDFNIQENVKTNHTDAFECTDEDREDGEEPELVVRRGNFMKLTFKFDRPYEKEKHDLKLCFTIGEKPSSTKGTMEQFQVDEDGEKKYPKNTWGAYLDSRSGDDIIVKVQIAANCIIGEWNLRVKTSSKGKDKHGEEQILPFEYKHHDDIFILFNPWCKDDGVYMEETDYLKEYIDCENGCVFRGSHDNIGGKAWNHGQFEMGILDISLELLRKVFNGKISKDMANPVIIARKIAAILNSGDDKGVLVGNWSGNYSDGESPTSWNGSPAILKQFQKSGPVKYGQCWVFACLTTTVCRCLGIPCRTVTNFLSAHNTEESGAIEKFYWTNHEGIWENYPHYGEDSVWNFHVWNDVWMRRDDLGDSDFHGWQAIDATPQERSEGVFTCGPCPLEAVKQGRVDLNYDSLFVFCEVGADECKYEVNPDHTVRLFSIDKTKIGKNISTKYPDGRPFKDHTYYRLSRYERRKYEERRRLDITDNYKYPEGSVEEREAVKKAYGKTKFRGTTLDPYWSEMDNEKVTLGIKYDSKVFIGSDLTLEISAKNEGNVTRDIMSIHLKVESEKYTGEIEFNFFERFYEDITLGGGQEATFEVLLTAEKYFHHLSEQATLHIEVTAVVVPLRSSSELEKIVETRDLRFQRPDLDVEGPEKARFREPVSFTVTFENPAPVPLTNCYIKMGSKGFKDEPKQPQGDVGVGETFKKTFTMTSKRKNEHEVNFTFESDQLHDISGSTSIEIEKF